ncbi:MAG: DNA pilot protein [Microvirus sp.]|nr:MAG: DNA pilot protein [Microvirus sp.]
MPIPIAAAMIASAAIAGGTSIWQNKKNNAAIDKANTQNADAIERNNLRNIQFERERMDYERKNSLADWERMNAYNSPDQVMQRYKEAGLNPHLIYGNGTSTSASSIQQTKGASPDTSAPQMAPNRYDYEGLTSGFDNLYKMSMMDQSLDNSRLQNELLQMEVQSKKLDLSQKEQLWQDSTWSLLNRYKKSGFDYKNAEAEYNLRGLSSDGKKLDNALKAFELNEMSPIKLSQAKEALRNLGYSNDVKFIDSELSKLMITPNTSNYAKYFFMMLKMLHGSKK